MAQREENTGQAEATAESRAQRVDDGQTDLLADRLCRARSLLLAGNRLQYHVVHSAARSEATEDGGERQNDQAQHQYADRNERVDKRESHSGVWRAGVQT